MTGRTTIDGGPSTREPSSLQRERGGGVSLGVRASAPDAFGAALDAAPGPRLTAMTNALVARASERTRAPPRPRPEPRGGSGIDGLGSVSGAAFEPTRDDEAAVSILHGAAELLNRRYEAAVRRQSHQDGSWVLESNALLA